MLPQQQKNYFLRRINCRIVNKEYVYFIICKLCATYPLYQQNFAVNFYMHVYSTENIKKNKNKDEAPS